MENGEASKVK